jgi:FKBP-type peptidyl-prolyl cis-trans isomerase FklB
MIVRVFVIMCMVLMVGTAFGGDNAEVKTKPTGTTAAGVETSDSMSQKDKTSYALGYSQGERLKQFQKQSEADIDFNTILKGFSDSLLNAKPALTDAQLNEVMAAFQSAMQKKQQSMMAKQQEKTKESGEKNKAEGSKFLAENKKKKGVKTLKSGLQYKVLTEGKGNTPKASDSVTVNYRGTLIDGTEFDSSYKRGQPLTFQVGGVIKGWTEALQLMKEGSKWQLFIPENLAYGDSGTPGGPIGPNAALIFEVELISIKAQ